MASNPIRDKKAPMTASSTQILFVDIQPEVIAHSKTNPPDQLLRSAVAVARIGRLFGLPMHVSVVPTGRGEPRLPAELAAVIPDVKLLPRTLAPALDDPSLEAAIKATGRHDLVVCGAVTEVAVLLACFGAVMRGHEVHVPVDACGGLSQRTEDAAFRRIEAFEANTAATVTLGAVLAMDLGSPKGIELMKILAPLMS